MLKDLLKHKYDEKIHLYLLFFVILTTSMFYQTDYFPIVIFLMVLVCLYILAYSITLKWKPILFFFRNKAIVWFIVFWLYILVLTFFRNNIQFVEILKGFISLSSFIFVFCISYRAIHFDLNKILKIIKYVAVIMCAWIFIFDFPLLMQGERIGFSVCGGNPNNAGTILGVFSIFILYKCINSHSKSDIFTFMLLVLFVILTGSKKALILVAVGLLQLLFENGHLRRKRLYILLGGFLAFLILCFTIPILYEHIGRRFLSLLGGVGIINYDTDNSTSKRVMYFARAFELWKENLIIGGGYDFFRVNSGFKTYSHCNYTEILVSSGIIGLVWFYGYYVILCFKGFINRKRRSALLFLLCLIAILISDIGSVTMVSYPIYYIIIYMFSLELCIKELSNYGE